MTTKEAAKYLGISYSYLRNMRHLCHTHEGPLFTMERHPRGWACNYTKEALDAWSTVHEWR